MNYFSQCYHDTSKVTDELVQLILSPGLEPGAVDVFLEFICYSGGPLPEELLPQVKVCFLPPYMRKWEVIINFNATNANNMHHFSYFSVQF
jgi:hypothetical protein